MSEGNGDIFKRRRDARRSYQQREESTDAQADAERRAQDEAEREAARLLREQRNRDRIWICLFLSITAVWLVAVAWGLGVLAESLWHWIHG